MARMSVIGGTGRSGTTDPMRGYANQDGPGNTTVDYGPHRGGFRPPSQPSSYVDHATPFYDAAQTPEALAAYNQRVSDAMSGYSGYQSGNIKDHINALMQARGDMQRQRFMDQGGQGETWDNRYSNENNWPRPTSSLGYSHGPGRPDYATRGTNPSPYGPGNTAPPMRGGGAPPASPMGGGTDGPSSLPRGAGGAGPMPGGRYGGPGMTTGPGGWGSAGGYNPMQSKSGMGQGPYGGPMMSTGGNPGMYGGPGVSSGSGWGSAGGMDPLAAMQARGLYIGGPMGGGNPYAGRGGYETAYMYDQPMSYGASPFSSPYGGMDPRMSEMLMGRYRPNAMRGPFTPTKA